MSSIASPRDLVDTCKLGDGLENGRAARTPCCRTAFPRLTPPQVEEKRRAATAELSGKGDLDRLLSESGNS
jgi:hypothetical protein